MPELYGTATMEMDLKVGDWVIGRGTVDIPVTCTSNDGNPVAKVDPIAFANNVAAFLREAAEQIEAHAADERRAKAERHRTLRDRLLGHQPTDGGGGLPPATP